MLPLIRIALIVLILLVAGAVVLLATVDLEPPLQRIEIPIPNDRFQR